MELNWSTFVLEIVNFLVLVWILKRFLYRPVLDVIARRRAAVDEVLEAANTQKRDAESLRQRYEEREADWQRERQSAREAVRAETEALRTEQKAALERELQSERDKARAAEQLRRAGFERAAETTALAHAASFASRLLEQVSSPELEARLMAVATRELAALPEATIAALRRSLDGTPEAIVVETAYPVSREQAAALERELSSIFDGGITVRYEQDTGVVCGPRISAGAWVLAANVGDELAGFAELGQRLVGDVA